MRTQLQTLLHHFKAKPDISGLEARTLYRIEALPRRIADLRERGFVINPVRRTDLTGKRYVRYVFLGRKH